MARPLAPLEMQLVKLATVARLIIRSVHLT